MKRESSESSGEIVDLLRQAKVIGKRYRQLTGRPLGITGEVAEYEAVRILKLELASVRQSGFDAQERAGTGTIRFQIKGRCFKAGAKPGRLGSISLSKEWDAVLMVILDLDFEAREIWRAERIAISDALAKPGSVARNERGALAVSDFKRIGKKVWARSEASDG